MENKTWKDNNLLKKYIESLTTIDGIKVNNNTDFRVSKFWIYEHYIVFNNRYFNGLLTESVMPVIERTNLQLGYTEYSYPRKYKNYIDIPPKDFLVNLHISSYYGRTEKDYCETLLHEMIHIYLTTIIKHLSSNDHDEEFISILNDINSYGWNVKTYQVDGENISLETDTDSLIKRSCLVAITTNGNNYSLIITNKLKASSILGYPNIRVFKIIDSNPVKNVKFTNNLDECINDILNGEIMITKMSKEKLDNLVKNGSLEEIADVENLKEKKNPNWPFELKTLPNGEEVYYWCSKDRLPINKN